MKRKLEQAKWSQFFTLCVAGCSGFLIFTQLGETPLR